MRVLDIEVIWGTCRCGWQSVGTMPALTEPAEPMLEGARQRFAEAGQTAFIQAPWQELPASSLGPTAW